MSAITVTELRCMSRFWTHAGSAPGAFPTSCTDHDPSSKRPLGRSRQGGSGHFGGARPKAARTQVRPLARWNHLRRRVPASYELHGLIAGHFVLNENVCGATFRL